MRPGPFIDCRALAADRRRGALWRTFGGECVSVFVWLVACGGLGLVLMLFVEQLAQMEAAIVLAERV